ncbi:unnamed protein product [Prorocentrum cordatum]|uniref:Uncharacterized protein n=1 Tax=Prorocentrum cordatum TaxID=2364126 RepID=A0ABN9PT54_9DINO|nr:unnamed protein product [Polarella glacialis]
MNERALMRRAIPKSSKLSDDEILRAHDLTAKVDEVEQNEPKASPLDEIAHLEHSDEVDPTVAPDQSGTFRTIRQKLKIDVPNDLEAYRKRMRMDLHLWLMLSARFMNKPWLEGTTFGPFERFVDYILGKKIFKTFVDEPDREVPSWSLVLSFEHRLRVEALKLVRDQGHALSKALDHVVADSSLRSLHFVTSSPSPTRACTRGRLPRARRRQSRFGLILPKGRAEERGEEAEDGGLRARRER